MNVTSLATSNVVADTDGDSDYSVAVAGMAMKQLKQEGAQANELIQTAAPPASGARGQNVNVIA
jgi:hypothetical protein